MSGPEVQHVRLEQHGLAPREAAPLPLCKGQHEGQWPVRAVCVQLLQQAHNRWCWAGGTRLQDMLACSPSLHGLTDRKAPACSRPHSRTATLARSPCTPAAARHTPGALQSARCSWTQGRSDPPASCITAGFNRAPNA